MREVAEEEEIRIKVAAFITLPGTQGAVMDRVVGEEMGVVEAKGEVIKTIEGVDTTGTIPEMAMETTLGMRRRMSPHQKHMPTPSLRRPHIPSPALSILRPSTQVRSEN